MAILEAKNVSFSYPDESNKALDNISFSVEPGEFVVLCGPSGSGKSTLLRLLKQEVAPHGKQTGELLYTKKQYSEVTAEQMAKEIGMVFQDPENQLVMDRVMEELVFGMENMGTSAEDMRKRVAEIVHFFGLEGLLERKTHELSGGQKQLVNLAAVLLLEPRILLLDEPTAQLDPVAAKEFISMVHRMNEEFGITIIIAEHRLEELFALADRTIVLEKGIVRHDSKPRDVIYHLGQNPDGEMYPYLPSSAVLYMEHGTSVCQDKIPLTVKEGKQWAGKLIIDSVQMEETSTIQTGRQLLQLKGIDFQYDKDRNKVLSDLSLTVHEGEWLAIVGANGTGKSTLLKLMAGLEKPQRGSIIFNGKKLKSQLPVEIGYLPQNPKLFFLQDTVEAELQGIAKRFQIKDGKNKIDQLLELFKLSLLKERHPYDLSGGEIQKAALAGVLLPEPRILLVDEPTKGLDPEAKRRFGDLLNGLKETGITIVMVTHDIEFAAKYATRCAMMFLGEITVTASPKSFFQGNSFYTTVINRITRDSNVPEVLTVEEARHKWHVHG